MVSPNRSNKNIYYFYSIISYFSKEGCFVLRKNTNMDKRALLNVKEMCEYLGIGKTKARELLADPRNKFTIRIGNRLYAHKERLDIWLMNQIM